MVEFLIITVSCLSIYTIFTFSYALCDLRKQQINENEEITTVVDETSDTRKTNEIENIGDIIIYNNVLKVLCIALSFPGLLVYILYNIYIDISNVRLFILCFIFGLFFL